MYGTFLFKVWWMAVTDNKINNGSWKAGKSRGCLAIERLKINFYTHVQWLLLLRSSYRLPGAWSESSPRERRAHRAVSDVWAFDIRALESTLISILWWKLDIQWVKRRREGVNCDAQSWRGGRRRTRWAISRFNLFYEWNVFVWPPFGEHSWSRELIKVYWR